MKINKIEKALIEGQLITRTKKYLSDELKKAQEKVDLFIGEQVRKKYAPKIPIKKNRVVLCSFQGDYTDNPKYIADELIRQGVDCELIWIGRKKTAQNPQMLPMEFSKVLEWYTYEAYEALMSAKVLVVNSVELFKRPYGKKKGQYVIQTWHGSLGIKRFDRSANSGEAWVKAADYSNTITDYLVSNSKFENDIYKKSYWPNIPILEVGHPRNDPIINCTPEEKAKVRKQLFKFAGMEDKGQKILLYAPTFRDSKQFDCYNLHADTMLKALETRFGGEWVAFYRYHPTVRAWAQQRGATGDNIVDMTTYPDMQDLIRVADVGVTDYSSWIYDFALTDKPAFIFATDLELYNNERGFAYPLETTPFPIARNNQQMEQHILHFDAEKYEQERQAFLKGKGCIEDGHASERVVEKIKELLQKG